MASEAVQIVADAIRMASGRVDERSAERALSAIRAALDAGDKVMAEELGLSVRYALREDGGTIWLNDHFDGTPLDGTREEVEGIRGDEAIVSRVVGLWREES